MPVSEVNTATGIETSPEALILVLTNRRVSVPWEKCSTKLAQATLQDLFGAYSEDGYIYAQVAPVENMRSDTVDITYQITEGSPATVRLVSFTPPAEIVRATDAIKIEKMSNEPMAMICTWS